MFFVCPSQNFAFSSFFWNHYKSQEKIKQLSCKILEGQTNIIMVFVVLATIIVAHHILAAFIRGTRSQCFELNHTSPSKVFALLSKLL